VLIVSSEARQGMGQDFVVEVRQDVPVYAICTRTSVPFTTTVPESGVKKASLLTLKG
jgi:hypothetical protein